MNDDFARLAIVFAISLTVNVGLAVALFRSAARARRLEHQTARERQPDESIERLELALDSLTAQVEQLASGQEFLSRVMTERLERPMPRHPRIQPEITPH